MKLYHLLEAFVFILYGVSCTNGSNSNAANGRQFPDISVMEALHNISMMKVFRHTGDALLHGSQNISLDCINYIASRNLSDLITFADASGKLSSGVLPGALYSLGSYEECMERYDAHYCLMYNVGISGKFMVSRKSKGMLGGMGGDVMGAYGACIPKACSEKDLEVAVKAISALTGGLLVVADNLAMIEVYGNDVFCDSPGSKPYSYKAVVMLAVCGFILSLCLVGTILDLLLNISAKHKLSIFSTNVNDGMRYDKLDSVAGNGDVTKDGRGDAEVSMHAGFVADQASLGVKLLLCFSLPRNIMAVMETDVPAGALTCINGIRFISLTWVILGHTIMDFVQEGVPDNALQALVEMKRFTFQAIGGGVLAVDSFFFLSGLLVGYLSMKRYFKSGSLPLVRFYVHRYIRLTVLYAFLIFFVSYLVPVFAKGPHWFMEGPDNPQAKSCEKYWWTHLLYINNFFDEDKCFGVAWYLANDMQFYVISPIILYAMYRFRWIGALLVNGFVVLASFIVTAVLIAHYNLSPVISTEAPGQNRQLVEYFKYVYAKPYCRIQPYIVGLVLGYLLTRQHKLGGRFRHMWYSLGWMLATGIAVLLVYVPYTYVDHPWNQAENIAYGTVFRFLWGCCLAWVVYACHYGYGGWVNSFLSWKFFVPLSRLTFAAYLIHIYIIQFLYGSKMTTVHYTDVNLAFDFVSVTVISYVCAFMLAICIEFPAFNVEKLIIKQ